MSLGTGTQGAGSLGKTTNIIDWTSPFTVMSWVWANDATASATHYFHAQGQVSGSDYALATQTNDGAGVAHLAVQFDMASVNYAGTTGPTTWTLATWHHIALVRTSTTQLLGYLDGVLEATLVHADCTGRSTDYQNYLHYAQGYVDAYKAWQAILTGDEIAAEMRAKRPLRFANLNAWLPTFPGSGENVRDYSGIGPDFTLTGTLSDGDPAPVSYGAPVLWVNQPAAVVQLPYSWVPELGPLLAQ